MSFNKLKFSLLTAILSAGLAVSYAFARNNDDDKDKGKDKDKTFTGTVGDALCGREHSMPGSAVECIRECIGKGGNYSLIVGENVYTLETGDKAALDTLEKQSGGKVTVIGTEKGNTIVVTSVKPAA